MVLVPIGANRVSDFMSRGLIVARLEMPLPEVRHLLETRNISAVPVVDREGHLRGLVSLSDLLHGPRGEAEPDAMPLAGDVMEREVVTIDEGASLHEGATAMMGKGIHRLVVLRKRSPVGVLSTRDVARAVLAARIDTPLRSRMTSPVLTVELGESIQTAIERLKAAGVRGLVVMDGHAPVGVFTQLEAVKARGLTPDQLQLSVEEAMSYETICLDIATPLHRIRSTKRVPAPHRTSSARFSRAYRA